MRTQGGVGSKIRFEICQLDESSHSVAIHSPSIFQIGPYSLGKNRKMLEWIPAE